MRRRDFVKAGIGASAFLITRRRAYAAYPTSLRLQKFVSALPLPGPDGIPLAQADSDTYPGWDYYRIELGSFRQQLHPNLPSTGQRLYGYANSASPNYKHLGGIVVAQKDKPVRIKFTNKLPATHMLPFDSSIPMPGNGGNRQDRAATHLHGGLVPWTSDGGPFHWFTPDGVTGASVLKWLPDSTGALTDDYFYPNHQSARLMWYHDHAIGITRLNAHAGLASAYLLTDSSDATFASLPWLPLVFQDKTFWDPAQDPNYSLYVPGALRGDLWYPYIYDTQLFGQAKPGAPIPSAVPEFWADTMLVNGHAYPYFEPDGGMYRLRLLNACNARFLRLSFALEHRNLTGEVQLNNAGLPVLAPVQVFQIGTEGGLFPKPVKLYDPATNPPNIPLVLGPGERADLLVDFSQCKGMKIILYNDAPAPYPVGSPQFDYDIENNKVAAAVRSGYGPNTRTVLKLSVKSNGGSSMTIPATLPGPALLPTTPSPAAPGAPLSLVNESSYPVKNLTLNESFDIFGRLQQLIGTNVAAGAGFGRAYLDDPTENVTYGSVEVWNIFNLTADTHPMHFHLFNVMVLRRQPFSVKTFNGNPVFIAPARGPEPGEIGWKETVQMHPGECTTVAVQVENPLPGGQRTFAVPGTSYSATVPSSPRTGGDEYVWHCHILEHEEHDMMRPLIGKSS